MRIDRDEVFWFAIPVVAALILIFIDNSIIELPFGLYNIEENAENLVIRWEFWVILLPLVIGIPFLGATIYLFFNKYYRVLSFLPFLAVLMLHGIFVPGLLLDEVVVTDESIYHAGGFWFFPTHRGFQFSDVDFVELGTGFYLKGHSGEKWTVHYRDGRRVPIDLGDLWEDNSELIQKKIKNHGVNIKL